MSRPATRAFYLTSGIEPVYALFDGLADPAEDARTQTTTGPDAADSAIPSAADPMASTADPMASAASTGVLLLPLFGNDDLCAYRARREWAKTLATAGHPTLRIDLPGTGDSAGGPHDPGRIEAWTDALATAAAWLRTRPGCARVAAIGIGLGGLLAYRAAAGGAAIDDLVLWSVPARGRTFVRQLHVLSQMEASRETAAEESDPALAPGALVSAGFVMSAETLAAVEALDLTKLRLPGAESRRVLLLERDGLEIDRRLRAALEQSGADVSTAPGPGYGTMVAPPQQSRSPAEVFATVGEWLTAGPTEPAVQSPVTTVAAVPTIELSVEGTNIRETPLSIPHGEGLLVGVLAEPGDAAPFCAVLLNAGALRHIGPNRMWVEMARRWAARGVPTLRVDLAGIGDADGDADALEQDEGFYVRRYIDQTHEVLAALAARGLPARFVLAGLCSGAYWAFQVALEDERVRGAFMVNPRALFWDWSIGGVRDARNVGKTLRLETWRKLLRGQITRERIGTIARGVGVALVSLAARMRAGAGKRGAGEDELGRALERLDSSAAELLGVFTAEEPVLKELRRGGDLERMRARSNVRIESIPGPLTSHTLEPLPLQRAVHALLDEALDRLLSRGNEPVESALKHG